MSQHKHETNLTEIPPERTFTRAEVDAEVTAAKRVMLMNIAHDLEEAKQLQHEVTLEAAILLYQSMYGQNPNDQQDDPDAFVTAIRALSAHPDLLARLKAEVRLEEAEWWAAGKYDVCKNDSPCERCRRLTDLRAEAGRQE